MRHAFIKTSMLNLLVQGVRVVNTTGNQDCHDKAVDSNDTRHDDWNDGLHNEFGLHHGHRRYTTTGLSCAIGSSESYSDLKMYKNVIAFIFLTNHKTQQQQKCHLSLLGLFSV